MKVFINKENCIGCGQCEETCDKIFVINDDGFAHTKTEDVPKELEEEVELACDGCPTSAIEIDNKENA